MSFTALTFSTLEVLSSTKMNQLYANDVYLKDTASFAASRITPQTGSYHSAVNVDVTTSETDLASVTIVLTVASKVLCLGQTCMESQGERAYVYIKGGNNTLYPKHTLEHPTIWPIAVLDVLSLPAGSNTIKLCAYLTEGITTPFMYHALTCVVLGAT